MYLSQLDLQNFRNFKENSFSFSPNTTLILGPNTSGKTNILEAIYLLATGRSFRAEVEKEMISYGKEIARVKGTIRKSSANISSHRFTSEDRKIRIDQKSGLSDLSGFRFEPTSADSAEFSELEFILTTGQIEGMPSPHKKLLVNGVSKRMIDFVGNLRAVLFWPEDLDLVTNSPSLRRKYLDLVLSQVDREYRRCLLSYEKGLRQRNRLLERIRDEGVSRSQLLFWDKLLVKNGGILTDKRMEFIDFVNNFQSNPNFQFSIYYDKSVISEGRLAQYEKEEVEAGATLVGPHRDDIKFEIRNSKLETTRNLSLFGSRGEQRLAVLWLKLCELEFMAQKTGERPILLLDDIFSELDHDHRKHVLEVIPQQQTIITTTDLHLVEKEYLKEIKIIEL
ncbi:DNA replication and repair protein RecF [Candidatus Gottesmanbacteria bacterium]|nr:DNA replication and repair protein RecF [Candidatus Gottesmanbacteria bacterium]